VTVLDPASPPASPGTVAADADQIGKNIAAVHEFYVRQERDLSRSQRLAENFAGAIGHPAFLGAIVGFVAIWTAINAWRVGIGLVAFDPAPYFWLQGLVSLSALLITTVVLIKQNRVARLAEQRAHLDLKVTLLIEQKVAKLIDLLEELRRDAPNIPDRHDPHATALQQAMDPGRVLEALTESAPLVEATESNQSGAPGASNAEHF
jgi:uncharacterized membrane protein